MFVFLLGPWYEILSIIPIRSLWFYFTLLQPCLLATFSVHWKNVLFQLVKCSVLVCSVNRMAVPYAAHDAVHPVPVPSSRNSVYIQLICNSKYVTETQCQLNYALKELSQSKRHNIIQAGIVVTTRWWANVVGVTYFLLGIYWKQVSNIWSFLRGLSAHKVMLL